MLRRVVAPVCALVLLGGAAGCRAAARPEPMWAGPVEPRAASPGTERPAASILSAHWARADLDVLGGLDGLAVVFSEEVEASTLVPEAFIVGLSDGRMVVPRQATLAPANEADENRTVLLSADLGSPGLRSSEVPLAPALPGSPADEPLDSTRAPVALATPVEVLVVGSLYGEQGSPLQRLGSEILPFDTPPFVVLAQWFELAPPEPGEDPALVREASPCFGSAAVVRTYWTEALADVQDDDLGAIRVVADGKALLPLAFDDHDDLVPDNVLDLCLPEATPAESLHIPGAQFSDLEGHRSAPVEVDVAR